MKRRFKIIDRFTNMKKADGTPMSRQQIHMLRKRARGLCWICNKPALEGGYFCLDHQIQARERMRKKLGCRRRNLGATSYKLDEARSKRAARKKSTTQKTATAAKAAAAKSTSTRAKAKTTKATKTTAKTTAAKSRTRATATSTRTKAKAKTLPRTTRRMAARN